MIDPLPKAEEIVREQGLEHLGRVPALAALVVRAYSMDTDSANRMYDPWMKYALEKIIHGIYPTDPCLVKPRIKEAMLAYGSHHTPTGDFVRAVLENNLRAAVNRADLGNLVTLPAIMMFAWSDLPEESWGSPERYDAWTTQSRPDDDSPKPDPVPPSDSTIVGTKGTSPSASSPTQNSPEKSSSILRRRARSSQRLWP